MRFASPSLASFALCAWALVASPVAAQPAADAESVLLLAPAEVRSEWTAALQLELAARGAVVFSADVPDAPTLLLGDAAAQRMAIERGAQAAVWVEALEEGWRLRMVRVSTEEPRVVPVARDADARTVALIAASLLDGAAEPPPEPAVHAEEEDSPPPPTPDVGVPEVTAARALSPPTTSAPSSAPPAEELEAARREPYVRWSGRIGLSAFLRTNEVRADPGFTLRAGIAMRYDWFEAALLHDLGLAFEKPVDILLPMGRVCLDVGATTARVAPAFHAGVRGCMGSLFATVTINDRVLDSALRTHASGGGYLAVSLPLLAWIRLFIRADLDVGWTDTPQAPIEFIPTLSTFLSFD